jgi:hypothetical protein
MSHEANRGKQTQMITGSLKCSIWPSPGRALWYQAPESSSTSRSTLLLIASGALRINYSCTGSAPRRAVQNGAAGHAVIFDTLTSLTATSRRLTCHPPRGCRLSRDQGMISYDLPRRKAAVGRVERRARP